MTSSMGGYSMRPDGEVEFSPTVADDRARDEDRQRALALMKLTNRWEIERALAEVRAAERSRAEEKHAALAPVNAREEIAAALKARNVTSRAAERYAEIIAPVLDRLAEEKHAALVRDLKALAEEEFEAAERRAEEGVMPPELPPPDRARDEDQQSAELRAPCRNCSSQAMLDRWHSYGQRACCPDCDHRPVVTAQEAEERHAALVRDLEAEERRWRNEATARLADGEDALPLLLIAKADRIRAVIEAHR